LGLGAGRRISGEREKPLRRSPGRVGKERTAALVLGKDHPIFDRQIVPPEAERVDQDELLYSPGHRGGDFAGEHAAKRVADRGRRIEAKTVERLAVIDD
jgi:hypothetical protein